MKSFHRRHQNIKLLVRMNLWRLLLGGGGSIEGIELNWNVHFRIEPIIDGTIEAVNGRWPNLNWIVMNKSGGMMENEIFLMEKTDQNSSIFEANSKLKIIILIIFGKGNGSTIEIIAEYFNI